MFRNPLIKLSQITKPTHAARNFSTSNLPPNFSQTQTSVTFGFFSTVFFGYLGYSHMGGKELIDAKTQNMIADSRLKNKQAEQIEQTKPKL